MKKPDLLTQKLYEALMLLALNTRSGLEEVPDRAEIHREKIESCTVNGINCLEHAENVLRLYRREYL